MLPPAMTTDSSTKPSSSVPAVTEKDQQPSTTITTTDNNSNNNKSNSKTKQKKKQKKKSSKRRQQQAVAPAPPATGTTPATSAATATSATTSKSKGKNKSKRASNNAVVNGSTSAGATASSTATTSHSASLNAVYEVDPTEAIEESAQLELTLQERGCSPDDEKQGWNEFQRRDALDILERILNEWAESLHSLRPTGSSAASASDEDDDDKGSCFPSDNSSISSSSQKAQQQPQQQLLTALPCPGVALITFGSYRLRVHRPDSDLDVLALCPPICHRGDFFTSLVRLLEAHPSAKDVHPIASAFTPVIKFLLNGIHIDLLFGSVRDPTKLIQYQKKRTAMLLASSSHQITSSTLAAGTASPTAVAIHSKTPFDLSPRIEYMIDDSDLVGMDAAGVRSFNGARVTQLLLEMVDANLENYRITLRAVKEWAMINGIYSNVLGFMGGVNFAILVAWVCMQHPKEPPTTLLRIFFRTFAMWHWPTPVLLAQVQTQPPPGVPEMPVWDPRVNPRDQRHLMPIITPAYPSMNSTYNVGRPQLRRIQEEMVRAAMLLEEGGGNWRSLFQPTDFFQRHANFLQITIRANNSSDFLKWLRLCESRMRLMITSLETPQVMAWPFAKFFQRHFNKSGTETLAVPASTTTTSTNGESYPAEGASGSREQLHEALFFIALRFAPGVEAFNIRYLASDFLYMVNSWEERVNGMDLGISHVLQQNLPRCVFEQEPQQPRSLFEQEQQEQQQQQQQQELHEPAKMETDPTPTPTTSTSTITMAEEPGPSIDLVSRLSREATPEKADAEMTDEVPEMEAIPPRPSTPVKEGEELSELGLSPARKNISEDDICISPFKRAKCNARGWRRTNSCNI